MLMMLKFHNCRLLLPAVAMFAAMMIHGGIHSVWAFSPSSRTVVPFSFRATGRPVAGVKTGTNMSDRYSQRTNDHSSITSMYATTSAPADQPTSKDGKVNGSKEKTVIGGWATSLREKLSRRTPGTGNREMLKQNFFAFLAGLCLSFNSGYINGCCLSGLLKTCGTGVPVAAFTGAYTNAGLAIGAGNMAVAMANLKMIWSFQAGAAIEGFFNPRPKPNKITPRYGPTFLLGSVLLALSATRAYLHPDGRSFLYLAAMANGLQNALSSAYSANLIRSSHMSGITSDIGMILGQMLGGNMENAWRFVVLSGLCTSFLVGGVVSWFAVNRFKSLALVFNAFLFFAIAMATIAFTSYQQRVSLWKAASGNWDWGMNEPPSQEYLSDLFARFDSDGSGCLDEEEFKGLLKAAGITGMTDIGMSAIFKSLDVDGSNGVSRSELYGLLSCDSDDECELLWEDDLTD